MMTHLKRFILFIIIIFLPCIIKSLLHYIVYCLFSYGKLATVLFSL